MQQLRKYGSSPFKTVLIHGGPGAAGEMAPVAEELASICSVCEPFQLETSIEAQLSQLHTILTQESSLPVVLIGFSYGAWLSFIFAAKYPPFVKKLILIGSAPFEEKYALNIMQTRLERLSLNEQNEAKNLLVELKNPHAKDKDLLFPKLNTLLSKADTYHSRSETTEHIDFHYDVYEKVWEEAKQLRASRKLLAYGKSVHCPVVAIHGIFDPHPSGGVQEPLSRVLNDFTFHLLPKCGHCPWKEQEAQSSFYTLLKQELRSGLSLD